MDQEKQADIFSSNIEQLLDGVIKDFASFTIVMAFYNGREKLIKVSDIAQTVNEPKRLVAQIIKNLMDQKIVHVSGAIVKTYSYIPDNTWNAAIYHLIKLWKAPQSHEAVLKRLSGI